MFPCLFPLLHFLPSHCTRGLRTPQPQVLVPNIGALTVGHVSGEPVDQMKLMRLFAFNLVAATATVFCFVTFLPKVNAIAADNPQTVSTNAHTYNLNPLPHYQFLTYMEVEESLR
jgi:hypothetical protein